MIFLSRAIRSFSSIVQKAPRCRITLYYEDKRVQGVSGRYGVTHIGVSSPIAKAHEIACSYFKMTDEWDRQLLRAPFCENSQLNWFEFVRADSPDIALGVRIDGDSTLVFNRSLQRRVYTPIRKPFKLSTEVNSPAGNFDYEMDYEHILRRRRRELSIVGLFNSSQFVKVTVCSTRLGFVRTITKIISDDGAGERRQG